MKIPQELHEKQQQLFAKLEIDRQPWWQIWRDLADYYLPRRYIWLLSPQERIRNKARNPMILDSTGTQAARTLASGMMNGVTSPSRPWFKLRIVGHDDSADHMARVWLDEVERRMLRVMAESNFYNSLAVMYLDLTVFGTAAALIYEDYQSVIRCYNPALGEYYLGQSARLQVNTFARKFHLNVRQAAEMFGRENLSDAAKSKLDRGGANLLHDLTIVHLIEPNDDNAYRKLLPGTPAFRETYWEWGAPKGEVLAVRGFEELPGIFPRWELVGNDAYGSAPALDALGDVIQLQHETKKKAQALDKMVSPPIVADIQLQHRQTSLLPGGVTYVAGVNNVGAKPIYTVNPPLGEMTMDIRELQARIRETFHNDLFKMISQLDTVRSATEIDARREEKLVLLGPVLERFENEALDPAIKRIYAIMDRAGLIPEPPEEIADMELEIQYESILTVAQRAVSVIPTERWVGLIGNLAQVYPQGLDIPDFDELIKSYGRDIGVPQKLIAPPDAVMEKREQRNQQLLAQQASQAALPAAQAAKLLSETDVGGGANALQQVLGG